MLLLSAKNSDSSLIPCSEHQGHLVFYGQWMALKSVSMNYSNQADRQLCGVFEISVVLGWG